MTVLLNMDKYPMRRFLLHSDPFRLGREASPVNLGRDTIG
jgi:hypothetical protein